ncbi:MAG: protein kinase [Planctomycetales bacterium]
METGGRKQDAVNEKQDQRHQDTLDGGAVDGDAMRDTAAHSSSQPQSQSPAEIVNEEFGRYRILKTLGAGAMGAVYLAHDETLDREVALKIPKFPQGAADTVIKRFYREARAAAMISHPNICPIYDVGEINSTHYITMQYVPGHELAEYVDSGKPQPQEYVAAMIRKVAMAMDEAHSHQIIHRDLKPANIMINQRNEPVVMDFGLARRSDLGEDVRITQTGVITGSPAYMSPEQLRGDPDDIGPPSDIYNLGVVLYEVLTGSLPFKGSGSIVSLIADVVTKQPQNPTEIRSDLDPQLAEICLKALAKTPAERFGSMKEFGNALGGFLKLSSQGSKVLPVAQALPTGPVAGKLSASVVRAKEQCLIVRTLTEKGQFAAASSILEQIATSTDPELKKYSDWAQGELPKLQTKTNDADNAKTTANTAGQVTKADNVAFPGINNELWDEVPDAPKVKPVGTAVSTPSTQLRSVARFGKRNNSKTLLIGGSAAAAVVVIGLFVLLMSGGDEPKDKGDEKSVADSDTPLTPSKSDVWDNPGTTTKKKSSSTQSRDSRSRNRPPLPLPPIVNRPPPLPEPPSIKSDPNTGNSEPVSNSTQNPVTTPDSESTQSSEDKFKALMERAKKPSGDSADPNPVDGKQAVLPAGTPDAAGKPADGPPQEDEWREWKQQPSDQNRGGGGGQGPPGGQQGGPPGGQQGGPGGQQGGGPQGPPPTTWAQVLKMFDTNKDKILMVSELIGPARTHISKADTNRDGKIVKREFQKFIKNNPPPGGGQGGRNQGGRGGPPGRR